MQKIWRGFWRLGPERRSVALAAAVALTETWLRLHIFGFRRTKKALDRRASAAILHFANFLPAERSVKIEKAQALAVLISSVARRLWIRTNCLEQALAVRQLLARRGIPAQIRFGARKEQGRFEAHAWLEVENVPLGNDGGEHRHFIPFDPSIKLETQTD